MLRTMLADAGYCEDDRERMLEGDLKEVVIPEIGGHPAPPHGHTRHGMGPGCVRPDLWVRLWAAQAERALGAWWWMTCASRTKWTSSVRAGGVIWKVERPGLTVASEHVSERLEVTPDLTIENTDTLADLRLRVAYAHAFTDDDGA
jgi:hypothetical protein